MIAEQCNSEPDHKVQVILTLETKSLYVICYIQLSVLIISPFSAALIVGIVRFCNFLPKYIYSN